MGVSLPGFLVLGVAAVLVGFSKTAINGTATVAIVLFAAVLPTRESTGALLVLLMAGDALAIWTYRRHADFPLIRRLIVPVLVGVALGAAFLGFAPVGLLKPVIGGIVVVMTLIQAYRMWAFSREQRGRPALPGVRRDLPQVRPARHRRVATAGLFGSLAGFTTMVANAGGPVMTLYLLRSQLAVTTFVGTLAWFFACVNLTKLPVSIALGLVRPERLALVIALVPLVVVGAALGRWLIGRISRDVFEKVVLAVAGLSGVYLMVS